MSGALSDDFVAAVERALPRVQNWFNECDRATAAGLPPPPWPWPRDSVRSHDPVSSAFLYELRRRRCPQLSYDEMFDILQADLAKIDGVPSSADTPRWSVW